MPAPAMWLLLGRTSHFNAVELDRRPANLEPYLVADVDPESIAHGLGEDDAKPFPNDHWAGS